MRRVRLTESQLHRVIKESVRRVLREDNFTQSNDHPYPYMIKTYDGEVIIDETPVWLDKPNIDNAYGDDVPFSLGSNQELIYIGE